MCENVLSVVFGANGSGKTTLARNVLGERITEHKCILGTYTLSDNSILTHARDGSEYRRKELVALGKYSNVCGGVDSVHPLSNAYRLASGSQDMFPGRSVLMESCILSTIFSTPLKFYLEMKYQKGFDVEIFLLYVSEKEALRRVFARNGGKEIKADCVCRKVERAARTFSALKKLGEFRCHVIDTVGRSSEEVFDKFMEMSNLYERN